MPTEAQINAIRRNAQKSTRPTSPEGKARSSLNALKSGIDAWSHIIPGEDPAELEAVTAAFLAQYHPADPTQLALVDTLVSTEWIQRRLRRVEAQLWNYQIDCLDKNLTQAEFLDAQIQHRSPLAMPIRTPSTRSPASTAASTPPTACSFAPSKPCKTSRPPRLQPTPPSRHPN